VAKGPTESVEIDRHHAYNATRRYLTIAPRRFAGEANVEGKIQHARSLDARTDDERQSSAYVLDKISNVVNRCDEFHETVNAGCQKALAVSDADHLEDSRGEVVEGVSPG